MSDFLANMKQMLDDGLTRSDLVTLSSSPSRFPNGMGMAHSLELAKFSRHATQTVRQAGRQEERARARARERDSESVCVSE